MKVALKIFLTLFLVVLGIAIGYHLPRGAGLVAGLMTIGSSTNKGDYENLAATQAFLDLESAISNMRKMVLADAETEQEVVEGMRWLLRVLAMSAEVAGDANPRQPYFQRMDTPARKIGGDNPDAEYDFAAIDGRYDYRITGNIGTVRYLGFTINAGQGMTPRRMVGYVNDKMLGTDDVGNFTLLLSKTQPRETGYWIRIPEDASGVLVRQYIANRETEQLARYSIKIMGEDVSSVPPTDLEIANAIIGTTYAMLKLSTLHRSVLPQLLKRHNQFVRATSKNLGGAISGTDNLYMISSYQLADDEALIIEAQPPETRYWNLSLETRWHECLNYLHRPRSKTLDQVQYHSDGSVTFIVAHQDPEHPNWLDTAGHNFGFLTFRWLETSTAKLPQVHLVKFSELKK